MIPDDFDPEITVTNVPHYSPNCHQLNGSSFNAVFLLSAAKLLQVISQTKTCPNSTVTKLLLTSIAVFYCAL